MGVHLTNDCFKFIGIDHNFHNNRAYAKTKNGTVVYMRKFNTGPITGMHNQLRR